MLRNSKPLNEEEIKEKLSIFSSKYDVEVDEVNDGIFSIIFTEKVIEENYSGGANQRNALNIPHSMPNCGKNKKIQIAEIPFFLTSSRKVIPGGVFYRNAKIYTNCKAGKKYGYQSISKSKVIVRLNGYKKKQDVHLWFNSTISGAQSYALLGADVTIISSGKRVSAYHLYNLYLPRNK